MKYFEKLVVPAHIASEMVRICRDVVPDVKKNGVEFDQEVRFSNGYFMVIQVCGPGDPKEESCWTQGVFYRESGNELTCTDAGESFLGEYHIEWGGDEYVVEVVTDGELNVPPPPQEFTVEFSVQFRAKVRLQPGESLTDAVTELPIPESEIDDVRYIEDTFNVESIVGPDGMFYANAYEYDTQMQEEQRPNSSN